LLSGRNVTHFLISSVKKVVKDWSNVDILETVKDIKAIPGALKPVSGGLQRHIAELAYWAKCDLLSEY